MNTPQRNPTNIGQNKIERQYLTYFTPAQTLSDIDEKTPLVQPSPLEFVESFTTTGITEKVLINRK